jgi:hypothetical protein
MPRDTREKNLCADALSSSKTKPVDQILDMLDGFIDRGCSEATALGVSQAFADYISARFRANEKPEPFDEVHCDETVDDGAANSAEAVFRRDRSFPAFERLRRATLRHKVTAERQLRAAAREVGLTA